MKGPGDRFLDEPERIETPRAPASAANERERPTEMHVRHLRYFVVAAEEENFNRAAERLNIAQPALSRRIGDLEQILGAKLFDRAHKRVRLSSAGRALLDDARQIILDVSRAAARCRRLARAETNRLSIGINDSALRHDELSRAFRDFHDRYPATDLTMGPTAPFSLLDSVVSGHVDGAFIYTRPVNDPVFAAVEVARDRFLIALPKDHPLAARETLDLKDLRNEEFLWLPRVSAPGIHDQLIGACLAGGLSPRISQHILSESSRLHLVSEGLGVTFVTATFDDFLPDRVVVRPVRDFSVHLVLEFVWRRDNHSQNLENFIDIVRRTTRVGMFEVVRNDAPDRMKA